MTRAETNRAAIRRRAAEASKLAGLSTVERARLSLAHHEARKARAAACNPFDWATYRDANRAAADLRAFLGSQVTA
jgi:hypothetical protein